MDNKIELLKEVTHKPEIKTLVLEILAAKAHAITLRSQVNTVYAEILASTPVYDDDGQRITNHHDLYHCSDDDLCNQIYKMADVLEKARGIKPQDMLWDYCPALVAESTLIDLEKKLMQPVCKVLDADPAYLWGDNRIKFIDLVIKAVLSAC